MNYCLVCGVIKVVDCGSVNSVLYSHLKPHNQTLTSLQGENDSNKLHAKLVATTTNSSLVEDSIYKKMTVRMNRELQ